MNAQDGPAVARKKATKSAKPARSASYHHGDLRQALLDVALELIAERGADGFTLREAARRIGVSHSAPYRHFADKDALLLAVAEAGFEELRARGEDSMRGVEDARARLRAFGEVYLAFAAEHPARYRVMFGRAFSKPTPALQRASDGAFELLVRAVADVLGVCTADAAHDSAMAIMAGVHGLATLGLDGRFKAEAGRYEHMCDVTLSLLQRGLEVGL